MSAPFIITSDWHLVSTDQEPGGTNETHPTDAAAVSTHIASLEPAGVIDLGDCKDHYGLDSADEHDQYIANVRNIIPWAVTKPGQPPPILPGNHDEKNDYTVPGSDFSIFNEKFWPAPYHFTVDWAEPQVRLIAYHARVVHASDTLPYPGFFAADPAERQWLRDQFAELPVGWQAIVCSHAPLLPAFGANIGHWSWLGHGGTEIQQILRDNASRVTAYFSGHRHANMGTAVQDGITHFNGPGMAYTLNNAYGGFISIGYDAAARTLTFDFLKGPPSTYPRISGYTPVVLQLPALPEPPPPPPPPSTETYTFESEATLVGAGPLAGSPVTLTGSIEVPA